MEKLTLESRRKLAHKLMDIYPVGLKPGTTQNLRTGATSVAIKLGLFYHDYGNDFDEDSIIKAVKSYVDSFNGNYSNMQILGNFIYTKETSALMSYLENPIEPEKELSWDDVL